MEIIDKNKKKNKIAKTIQNKTPHKRYLYDF